MLKGVLSLLLLQLVLREEDYGYSLVVRLQQNGFHDLSEGSVYPALTRLEGAGLLGSRLLRSSSGPARKYYAITPAGRVELERGLEAWQALVTTVTRTLEPTGSPA
jgi:PadR family transcriptional regulator PadR